MAPGRTVSRRTRQTPEAAPTEYEKLRAQNMLKNNQMFQRLGLSSLATMIGSSTIVNRKDHGPQESGSLYDGEDVEGSDEEEVSKDSQVAKGVRSHNSNHHEISTKDRRGAKRVMAPDPQQQPIRVTRQRSATIIQESTESQTAATQPNSLIQDECDAHIGDEVTDEVQRGRSMGRQLESLSRGLGTKIPIQIAEGKRRPEPPIQAAKLASEGGIILRQHIPILHRWKEYKMKENEDKITNYIGKLAAQFTMDVDNKVVKDACVDMLKGGQRQMRYKLKKEYFDNIPANQVRTTSPIKSMTDEQWRKLVEMWSSPKHKNTCIKNQLNREKVQFQQRTGSQCYISKAYVLKQDKYKDTQPCAIDLFKEMHCSKKKGFSETVQKAIVDMEAMVATPAQDGQQAKSSTEAVSHVLPRSSTFLRNVGLQSVSNISSKGAISVRVQDLQTQLETERQEAAGLREEVDSLKTQAKASEATIANQSNEIDSLKKSIQENNSLLRQLLSFNQGQVTHP